MTHHLTRRGLVATAAAAVAVPAWAQGSRAPAPKPEIGLTPSVVTSPPRQWGPGAPPAGYPDPDVIHLDDSFGRFIVRYSPIQRIATGYRWTEGPAWSGQGQYLVFSDVQGDTLYRLIWETGEVTAFRKPSFNANGNTFDFQGRQVSCQHFFRRLVRWENDGSLKILADNYKGTPLIGPNDVVAHPDGSYWFTDNGAGASLNEGHPDVAGGPQNPNGLYDPNLGVSGAGLVGSMKRELPSTTYRLSPDGVLAPILDSEPMGGNGLCFSPDYKILYLISGARPAVKIWAFDVAADGKLSNKRIFSEMHIDGVYCHPDGMRADRAGNLWVSANGPLGYSGCTVWNPAGKAIGRVRIPEGASNICFAGPKRDCLVITASQSVYMLRVGIQGAAPG